MSWFSPRPPWDPRPPTGPPSPHTKEPYPVYDEQGNQIGSQPIRDPGRPPYYVGDPNFPYAQPPPAFGAADPLTPPADDDWYDYLGETSAGDGEGNFTPALPGDAPLGSGQMWPTPQGNAPMPLTPYYPPYGNTWGWGEAPPPWVTPGDDERQRR